MALFALHAASSQPPAIAEFAPQAQQQIKQAPQEQTALAGTGAGGDLSGAFLPSPSPNLGLPSPSPTLGVNRAKVRHCIGNPPRQIDDPQSPPCVPYYDGPTPPSSYHGITDSGDINVMFRQSGLPTVMPAFQRFFNQNFEFYGRGIKLWDQSATNYPSGSAGQRAAADAAYNYPAFGGLDENNGGGIDYTDEMASKGLISVLSRPYLPESYLSSRRPYAWSYPMAADTLQRTMASWACARLKGQPANHAGVGTKGKPRVYGLMFTSESLDIPISSQPFQDGLSACGITLAYVAPYESGSQSSQQNDAAEVTQMQAHNVTTIFCFCEQLQGMGQFASSQAYYPEWIVSSYILNDYEQRVKCCGLPASQAVDSFGLSFVPMIRAFPDHPSTWADPADPYQSDTVELSRDYEYWVMLLMASGIQMAGPNLTPQTFAAGLQRAAFPNPDDPIMAGKVGFLGGSHSMTMDAAEIYWSATTQGPYPDANGGTYCYVDHGARHSIGNFPVGGDPFFSTTTPCDSGQVPVH
ncbi:MAG TPA: hypothetical protein VNV65_09330 [Candidatus Solibacter sp.]|nr:hypothetical protein [Candidatus Solibacter sp.]